MATLHRGTFRVHRTQRGECKDKYTVGRVRHDNRCTRVGLVHTESDILFFIRSALELAIHLIVGCYSRPWLFVLEERRYVHTLFETHAMMRPTADY